MLSYDISIVFRNHFNILLNDKRTKLKKTVCYISDQTKRSTIHRNVCTDEISKQRFTLHFTCIDSHDRCYGRISSEYFLVFNFSTLRVVNNYTAAIVTK